MNSHTLVQQLLARLSRTSRRQRIVAGLCLVGIAWVLTSDWKHRDSPANTLSILEQINRPEDIERFENYLTPQGKDILLWLMSEADNKPSSGIQPTYSEPVISGDQCDVAAHFPDGTCTIRLLRFDRWRFQDIYIETVGDQKVAAWVSEIKNHPYKTWWKRNSSEMLASFMRGFMIGLSAGAAR